MRWGGAVNLTAKSGKTNVTKKGTWKSSKKSVATISKKKGKLKAKKAGTTYITIKYKKKTSKKLKVVVKKKKTTAKATPRPKATATPKPAKTSAPNPTPSRNPNLPTYTLSYNANGGTISGSATQSVSGEIFNLPTVKAPSRKKFIGWYDKKSGGNRIYETYVPTKDTTIYAHYVDSKQETQTVKFSLGCNYGGTYSFIGEDKYAYPDGYDWLNEKHNSGPISDGDDDDVSWAHLFTANGDGTFTINSLPTPEVPGCTFEGWYKERQIKATTVKKSTRINVGDKISVTDFDLVLHARFSRKLTISFEDFRGNKYDDIVVDTYHTIGESGAKLPVPEIPGATFKGWVLATNTSGSAESVLGESGITEDTMFLNCIGWTGWWCFNCDGVYKDGFGGYTKPSDPNCNHFVGGHGIITAYEDTDHITLCPCYGYDKVNITFDPMGGLFPNGFSEIARTAMGSMPCGTFKVPLVNPLDPNASGYYYGNGFSGFPVVSRSYYELDGWYYKDDNGEEQEFKLETILSHDMEVYAKWKPGKSTVEFLAMNFSGGFISEEEGDACGLDSYDAYEVPTESSIAEAGKRIPIPSNRDGRKFLGWFVHETDEPFTEDMPIVGDVWIYAEWGPLPKELPIKLDFVPNGGTFDEDTFKNDISGLRGTVFKSFPPVSKPDYDFLGWYVLKPGATDYNDDDSFIQKVDKTLSITNEMVDDLGDDDDENDKVTLVARWQQKPHAEYITMSMWDRGAYETIPIGREEGDKVVVDPIDVQYNSASNSFPYWFKGVVMPETVENRKIVWSSSNSDVLYIGGADADGTVVTNFGANLKGIEFGKDLTPTREGYDVVLTARAQDNPTVTFEVPIHVYFPED